MGCLLDVLEKSCDYDVSPLLQFDAEESAWLCCCPLLYMACEASDLVETCVASLAEHILLFIVHESVPQREIGIALQRARGAMWRGGRWADGNVACGILALEEPHSLCGDEVVPPVQHCIAREDLNCEMPTWQWESLGDGSEIEFGKIDCPFHPLDAAEEGATRKHWRLSRETRDFLWNATVVLRQRSSIVGDAGSRRPALALTGLSWQPIGSIFVLWTSVPVCALEAVC